MIQEILDTLNPRQLHGREEAEYNTGETTMKFTHPFPLMLNTPKGNHGFLLGISTFHWDHLGDVKKS